MNKTIRDSLDHIVVEALKPVSLTLAFMYGAYGALHLLLLSSQKETMATIAVASALIFLSFRILLRFRPLPNKLAHPLAAVICLICMLNVFAHCFLVSDPGQPINLLLLLVGAGMIFTSLPWLLSMFAVATVGWYILNTHLGVNLSSTINFALQLVTTIVLALISFVIRVQTYTGLEKAKMDLEELSLTDALTGLRNRRAFNEIAEQQLRMAQRSGIGLALIYIDLDNMKPINDNLGHEVGDRALQELATILTCNLRESDLIARLGGDEFCVLLTGGAEDVEGALERLNWHVTNRNQYDAANQYSLQFSAGIVFFDQNKHIHIEDMLKGADEKMYEEKRRRKASL